MTVEVRFITLSDDFFERIGIDFDFDINSEIDKPFQIFGRTDPSSSTTYQTAPFIANGGPPRDVQDRNLNRSESVSVGLSAPNIFSTDMDIPFRQDSFALAVPQFGGFDPAAGASFGFAILSDIETYFFLNAAQGDRRTNVLQAPKVTLFNGQQASVSDQSQSPFVISVIPVVGDFAAAQQPVIIVLSEGTFMTVQAVVSSDRRFVRLTVVPFFSNIGDVDTFTFTGSSTTTTSSGSTGPVDDTSARDERDHDHHRGHHGPVADVRLRHGDHDRQRARWRNRALGRHQAPQRGPYRVRRADLEQASLRQSLVQERRHRSRDVEPDDDGHAADHHPGGGRVPLGHQSVDDAGAVGPWPFRGLTGTAVDATGWSRLPRTRVKRIL